VYTPPVRKIRDIFDAHFLSDLNVNYDRFEEIPFNIAESRFFLAQNAPIIVCHRASPGPAGRAYGAPPDPIAAFDGPTSKRGKEEGKEESGENVKGGKETKKGVGKKRKNGRGNATHSLWKMSSYAIAYL